MKNSLFLLCFFLYSLSLPSTKDPYGLDDQIFYIENVANGKYLDGKRQVPNRHQSKVIVWPAGAEDSKQWKFEYVRKGKLGGVYLIINQDQKLEDYRYLEVSSYEVATNGGTIQLWEKHDQLRQKVYGDNQLWQVHKNNNGTFSIASAHAKSGGTYVMEVPKNDLSVNGAAVQLYWNRGYKHQQWQLKSLSE